MNSVKHIEPERFDQNNCRKHCWKSKLLDEIPKAVCAGDGTDSIGHDQKAAERGEYRKPNRSREYLPDLNKSRDTE